MRGPHASGPALRPGLPDQFRCARTGARRGPSAGLVFTRLSRDLSAATDNDQSVFNSTARSASSAYTGLEAVTIAAALLMAAACAWGLSRRLAEYR